MRRPAVLWITLATSIVLVACSDRDAMPRDWPRLLLADGDRCPEVTGRFFDSSEPIARILAGRFAPHDSASAEWHSFELAGAADSALHVTVRYTNGEARTGRVQKGGKYGSGYYCEDGWLKVGDRDIPETWDHAIMTPGRPPRRRAMRVAPDVEGALVARLDGITYDEFTVWCGDGCKGFPLPWTWDTRSSWSRATRWEPGKPPPRVAARRQAEAQARRDPVYLAEQALEHGPAVPGIDVMRKRALAALVPGMQLRAVAPRDSGWHLSLEFEELSQLARFMTHLGQAAPVAELRVAPLYRAKNERGHWIDVVHVRFEEPTIAR